MEALRYFGIRWVSSADEAANGRNKPTGLFGYALIRGRHDSGAVQIVPLILPRLPNSKRDGVRLFRQGTICGIPFAIPLWQIAKH